MTWDELVRVTAENSGHTLKATREVLRAAFDAIGAATIGGDRTYVPGFGVFLRRSRAQRRVCDPSTGQPMRLPSDVRVGFRCAANWKRRTS